MNSKLFGGILLVVGTTIGAGMLALPVATAQLGFWGSMVLLVACWGIMTASAFLFLEVNLWLPPNSNLISMAGATLGKGGQTVTWFIYLLLLYSILSAYIAGGGDLFHYLLSTGGFNVSFGAAAALFSALLGVVVYLGIRSVDYVNRGLMFGKMGAYFLLVLLILPFISTANLDSGEFKHIIAPNSVSIAVVAFTSMMIIPSLRTYFNDDVASLRKAIFYGSLIPLICYIAWDLVILGVVPLDGNPSMNQIMHSSSSNSDLIVALTTLLHKNTVTTLAKFFTSICMATSFLSISLCLSDFLADGLRLNKQGKSNIVIYSATFLPPLLTVLYYPNAFMRGLQYAGISCFILMILLPALMAWRGRYYQPVTVGGYQSNHGYQIGGGKMLLVLLVAFAAFMIAFGVTEII